MVRDLKWHRHQTQSEWNERAPIVRQLDCADISTADFSERPGIKKPFRSIRGTQAQSLTSFDRLSADRAQLNIVQHNPSSACDVGRESQEVEQGRRMSVVGVDKHYYEFVMFRQIAD